MKIEFANSFSKSIKRLIRHQTWWYQTYSLFRHDLPRFFKNVWTFRKALWSHYWFDHHGTLKFLEIGLTNISDTVEKHGHEVDESRLKKVAKMRRAIELIKNYNESNYIEMAESELGPLVLHDWEFEPVPDKPKLSSWETRLLEENFDDYFKKYPLIYKRVLNGEGVFGREGREDDKQIIAMNIGHINHDRARKLLFKIMSDNIERWWD